MTAIQEQETRETPKHTLEDMDLRMRSLTHDLGVLADWIAFGDGDVVFPASEDKERDAAKNLIYEAQEQIRWARRHVAVVLSNCSEVLYR